MLENLRGGPLWAVTLIVLGALGAATFLADNGTLTGADWLIIATAVLASVGILTGAQVAARATVGALQMPPPVAGPNQSPPVPPEVAPDPASGSKVI